MSRAPERRGRDILFVRLTRDGRIADARALDELARHASAATDCFVFCHGWLYDERRAQEEASRFFANLEPSLAALRERVIPLRVALHWPSKPFADAGEAAEQRGVGCWPTLERRMNGRHAGTGADLVEVLEALCEAHVSLAPEEDRELDALRTRVSRGANVDGVLYALSFWTMKRRAGDVGERFGREWLAPLWSGLRPAPRLHLVGHSFGAKLATSIVLGGVRPESLSLLLGAFSAFAFAPEVPGTQKPGFYHRVLAERMVQGRIVVLRSDRDTTLGTNYQMFSGSSEVGRVRPASATAPRPRAAESAGRKGHAAAVVATSALGAVGALGIGAPEVDLVDAQQIGLPRYALVNVDGSRVVSAHRDIEHPEVSRLLLLAAGLLEGGPDGLRARRRTPFDGV